MTTDAVGAPEGGKVCPACKEAVLAEAKVCKHCGRHFGFLGHQWWAWAMIVIVIALFAALAVAVA